ncbi:hypothetical protein RND81_12G151100 [Saponaria officinalis]|uniref:Membrane lipoprotein n=1 Tax=Saponaria officinalis TaxID=3572 RepID=A0AAW1HAW0_SAPOF
MSAPENPKVGGCYIWVISFLLFVFTVSGAAFLLLYVTQPASATTSRYAIIGVSLVFLPWIFWVLTFFYRVLSRCCGFRMICFRPFGYADNDKNAPAMRSNPIGTNAVSIPIENDGLAGNQDRNLGNGNENENENLNGNENRNRNREPTSPRRVHFGGVVILGEDENGNTVENQGSPQALSRSSSSASSSSSSSRHSNESETPLRLSMA